MARFGKIPVTIPSGVNLEVTEGLVKITGPKGNLTVKTPRGVKVEVGAGEARVSTKASAKSYLAQQGTIRSLLMNAITGVTEGFSKTLEMVGAGFRAEVRGQDLVLTVGYSHPVTVAAPEGTRFSIEKNFIKIEGIDKEVVGQIAADVRQVRAPEPYKGKGIKYVGEVIRRKAGKAAAKTVTA